MKESDAALHRDRASHRVNRGLQIAPLVQHDTQEMERGCVRGMRLQHLPPQPLRTQQIAADAALLSHRQRLLERYPPLLRHHPNPPPARAV